MSLREERRRRNRCAAAADQPNDLCSDDRSPIRYYSDVSYLCLTLSYQSLLDQLRLLRKDNFSAISETSLPRSLLRQAARYIYIAVTMIEQPQYQEYAYERA